MQDEILGRLTIMMLLATLPGEKSERGSLTYLLEGIAMTEAEAVRRIALFPAPHVYRAARDSDNIVISCRRATPEELAASLTSAEWLTRHMADSILIQGGGEEIVVSVDTFVEWLGNFVFQTGSYRIYPTKVSAAVRHRVVLGPTQGSLERGSP